MHSSKCGEATKERRHNLNCTTCGGELSPYGAAVLGSPALVSSSSPPLARYSIKRALTHCQVSALFLYIESRHLSYKYDSGK